MYKVLVMALVLYTSLVVVVFCWLDSLLEGFGSSPSMQLCGIHLRTLRVQPDSKYHSSGYI